MPSGTDDALELHTWGTWVLMAWDGPKQSAEVWHPVCVLAGPPPTERQVARALRAHGHRLPWWDHRGISATWPRDGRRDRKLSDFVGLEAVGPTILTRALEG